MIPQLRISTCGYVQGACEALIVRELFVESTKHPSPVPTFTSSWCGATVWTMQVRTFTYTLRSGQYWCEDGYTQMDDHIQRMIGGGWEVLNSANDTGHVRVGKTLVVAGMTGGLSLLFGGSRTAKTITLTFKTDRPAPP